MSLRHRWHDEELRKIIDGADASGGTRVKFDTRDAAEKFRYACYSLRRRKGHGRELSFVLEIVQTEAGPEIEVLIKQTPVLELRRKEQ